MRAPEFWKEKDFAARLTVLALTPVSWLYGASVAYKRSHARPFRPKAKVICVGNLTVGGSGKTPIAIAIARALQARGLHVVFLSRGYGGRMKGPVLVDLDHDTAEQAGDEPLLLASVAPVIVARDRQAGAELADAIRADVIVMDDGHQNFSIAKDLSIVVVDAATAFGNGRVIPSGPLREPVARGLSRADAVVLVGEGAPSLGKFTGPSFRAILTPVDVLRLSGKRVVAFAGIGRPEKFFTTLRVLGADIVESKAYADHHAYTAAELARLRGKAGSTGAMLVTTEKDYVRLSLLDRESVRYLPVRAAFSDQPSLERLLDRIMPTQSPPNE